MWREAELTQMTYCTVYSHFCIHIQEPHVASLEGKLCSIAENKRHLVVSTAYQVIFTIGLK